MTSGGPDASAQSVGRVARSSRFIIEDPCYVSARQIFQTVGAPLLRLGYLVVPAELVDAFSGAKRLADRHAPALEQLALAELIDTGAYERHVRRARRRNADRRATLLQALSDSFGNAVTVEGSDAGLHVVWFNGVSSDQEARLAETAQKAGVGIYPISPLYSEAKQRKQRGLAGFVLGYAALDARAIRPR